MRRVHPIVILLFFLSGATGLIYQVLWTRQLALVFGVTTYAISTVLATFMGGLALGSWLCGRRVDRLRNPLALYAVLEAGIAVYALLVPALFTALRPAYIGLHALDLSYTTFSLGRALLAAGVLLLPTTLMGGTFPALTRFWVQTRGEVARGAGLLYFVNTAGAIMGCTLAGFVLLERLGIAGTTRLAALANLLLAGVAALLARRLRPDAPAAPTPAAEDADGGPLAVSERLVLAAIGISGFVSLAAEVLWSRALLRYLYNSTYAFTTMLATFLLGIALGSALFTVALARRPRPLLLFAWLQGGVGVGFAAAAIAFPHLRELTAQLTSQLLGTATVTSFSVALGAMVVRAAVILLPPTILLGALFPLATALCVRRDATVGLTVGRVYAVNTLGAILGALAAAFVLIPGLGMQGTLRLLVGISILSGAAVALAAVPARRGRVMAVAALALLVTLGAVPPDVFRRTFTADPRHELVYYAEGATDTVGVVEHYGQRVILYEDQRGTASTYSYGVNFFLGHLPMLLHPGTPRRVLHICFGVGNSLSAVATHAELERVDNVELSPHVLEAAEYFWTNDGVIDHPKVRTIIDDGRNFLLTTHETYDVILLEPPETFTAGVINLYTTEFYRLALARLAPDGIMMQWIPTGMSPLADERRLFRAFADVFPHSTMWWQLDGGCALLIGTRQPLRIDYQRLRAHLQEPGVARDMGLSQIRDVDHLLSFFTFDEAAFADFVRDVSPTTDDRTMLDFSMPRYLGSGFGFGQFTTAVEGRGQNPIAVTTERHKTYMALRRSVVPSLTNLGGDTPETVAARIAAQTTQPFTPRWFTSDKWPARASTDRAAVP